MISTLSRMPMRATRCKQTGFVLLEVVVAMTIVGIGFAVLFAGMSESSRNISRIERFEDRQLFTRNLFSKIDLIQQFRVNDSAHGTWDDGTRWRLEVRPFAAVLNNVPGSPAIVRIELRLEWNGRSGIQTKTIETYRVVKTPLPPNRNLEGDLRALE